jgi:BirA family biotin operon repressor/biotin-[acetyl-CoA-carboxylase] ligase
MTARAHTPLIDDYHLLSYDVLDSTNEEAKRLAGGGASHGAVIWAKRQTHGKGRMGREWISPEGNLYVTFLLKPSCGVERFGELSFIAAMACVETIEAVVADAYDIHCKWPNDILLSNQKIAGILLESFNANDQTLVQDENWVAVGMGINIESHPDHVLFPATSLRAQGVELISAKIVLSRLVYNFMQQYDHWCKKGFKDVRKSWMSRAYMLGHKLCVMQGDDAVEGVFEGIDTDGAMLLKMPDASIKRIVFGDVQMVGE